MTTQRPLELLTGKKVFLKPLTSDRLELVRTWRNQDRVRSQFFNSTVITVEQHYEWWLKQQSKTDDLCFVIHSLDSQLLQPIGFAAIYDISTIDHTAEVGRLMIGEERDLNHGYMTDTLHTLIRYASSALDISYVYLWVLETNTAGIHCYKRAGFTERLRESGKILMAYRG